MMRWVLTFFAFALVTSALGFLGMASFAAGFAKVLLVVFFILLAASLIIPRIDPNSV